MTAISIFIWAGAALTLIGIGMLIWCILLAVRARKAGLDDAELKARLQKVVTLKLAALAVSAIGLMMVVFGVFLA